MNIHSTIKFWGRKSPELLCSFINGNSKILDPFCGSGTSGLAAILNNSSAFLSDVNPVSVFITYNSLSPKNFNLNGILDYCKEVEEENYKFREGILQEAVWVSFYECPECGAYVDPRGKRGKNHKLFCKECNSFFRIVDSKSIKEKPIQIKIVNDKEKRVYQDKESLEEFLNLEKTIKIKSWYPDKEFRYINRKIFSEGPQYIHKVKHIFFNKGLASASSLYSYIEDAHEDLYKLVFISSLFAATKMIPYSKNSGPSWKLPRYWIPPLRIERNFCRTFLSKFEKIKKFKDKISKITKDYKFEVSYTSRDAKLDCKNKKMIKIAKQDARKLEIKENFDLIILDPPHYNQINYFELTYLWQLWLYGKKKDKRFDDFSFWNRLIDVNTRLGRNLEHYNNSIVELMDNYSKYLTKKGKLILMLHSSNKDVLNSTLEKLKSNFRDIKVEKANLRVTSSAQGIHGRIKKHLYLVNLEGRS